MSKTKVIEIIIEDLLPATSNNVYLKVWTDFIDFPQTDVQPLEDDYTIIGILVLIFSER